MPAKPYTSDELEAMFHTVHMLVDCRYQIGQRIPKKSHKFNADLLLLNAAECRLMEVIFINMSKAKFEAMRDRYFEDDPVRPALNHPGMDRVQ